MLKFFENVFVNVLFAGQSRYSQISHKSRRYLKMLQTPEIPDNELIFRIGIDRKEETLAKESSSGQKVRVDSIPISRETVTLYCRQNRKRVCIKNYK